ncbi:hypothetical protein SMD44_p10184 (plasmid) [Streptomyces alboflavus]|uniref:Uncharacterized protein n=1 Tax=Streptomyces alboflavus TaxID=67267 RepID=A0A291W453_9ACTN|nr:hypothetical protein [Streptomyces alboflavus]ATM24683.1 hypothetical protein SMD44_p10184 [Streptomyces alboflavus]
MINDLNLRIALAAHTAVLRLAGHLHDHVQDLREDDERGDNNISMIMWIVGIVAFAAMAIAAFKVLGQGKLADMKGL